MLGIDISVGEYDIADAVVNALLCLMAQILQSISQSAFTAVHGEQDRQLGGIESFVSDVTQDVQLCVVQYGVGQTHHLAVGLIGSQNAGSHCTDIFGKRHDQFLTYGVDGGVGDLGKLLSEVIEEYLRTVACNGQWGIVTHGSHRLCSIDAHGYDSLFNVFLTESEGKQFTLQIIHIVTYMTSALEVLQLNTVGAEPFFVGMGLCQALFDFSVVIDLAFQGVYEQQLTRLQSSLLGYLSWFEVHHSHLTGHHHHSLVGDGIAAGAQTVAVKHSAGISAIAEEESSRTIPGLHQDGVIFVESLKLIRYGILVIEALWYHDSHSLWQRETAHDEEFKYVVQTGRVTHVGLYDGTDILHASQFGAVQHTFSCLHPRTVASYGIDFSIVCKQTEGLSQ